MRARSSSGSSDRANALEVYVPASPMDGAPGTAGEAMTSSKAGVRDATSGDHRSVPTGAIVLANRLPFPPDDGWKVRTFHIVRSVARIAPVTLLVFHDLADAATIAAARTAFGSAVELIVLPAPRAYTVANVIRGIFSNRPVHFWNQESTPMREALQATIDRGIPDFVLAESTFMEGYLRYVPAHVPILVDTHNVDSITFRRYVRSLRPGLRRMYASLTVRKLRRLERDVYGNADAVWVCSDEEREIVRAMAPGCNVWTVPNGVDTSLMAPHDGDMPSPHRAVFFGRLDYFPNVDAIEYLARDIVPALRARISNFELVLAGPAASPRIPELAHATPGLRYVGRVDDVRQLLVESAVVLVPLRVGGGTRLKIIEAMAAGRPIVTTTIGAEGLDVMHDRDLLLADDTSTFVEATVLLLADPQRAKRIGATARETARRRYDWTVIGDIVETSISRLLAEAATR
jgi:glycosyltransferase involved in cell wall biosynthesis